jgi:CRISPR system Cascade subunit CasD
MTSVLLRLEGPLQSWGTRSRFARRDTENEPSKSGVVGIIGAALGMRRDEDATLARLSTGSFAVRIDREGTLLSDYHTVGDGKFRGEGYYLHGGGKNAVITHRDYLQGASFLAAISFADDSLAREVAAALEAPRWPLFLGRRSCPPSLPVRVPGGAVDAAPAAALRAATFPSHQPPLDAQRKPRSVRLLVECAPGDPEGQPRQDQPLSFRLSGRHFVRRFVRTDWIAPADLHLLPQEEPCISLVAF